MNLYHFPLSPYSHKVQFALLEKGIQYEEHPLNVLDPNEQKRIFEMYPLGKLPLLEHNGNVIPESSIIVEYLDELVPESRLIPESKPQAREARLIDRMADFYLSDHTITLFFMSLRPEDQRDKQKMERALRQMKGGYQVLDEKLASYEGAFYFGEHLTLADVSLLTALRLSKSVVPFDTFSHVTRYYEQHCERPVFRQLDQQANTAQKEVLAFLSQSPN